MKGFRSGRDILLFIAFDSMKSLAFIVLGAASLSSVAAPIHFQSSEQRAALVELYTSEGCSSCPPAEAWLSKLKNAPGLWTNFVPVAFHVDYWNSLGWRDKLSDPQFSARQQQYAHIWAAENVYTPEFVLNGREWHNWLEMRGAPSASSSKSGVLNVTSDDTRHWRLSFVPAAGGADAYEATAAILVSALSTDVKAGENAGRHLQHDFAALSLITAPLTRGTNHFEGDFVVDSKPGQNYGRLALAVWVTRRGQLEPLQATGGWLPDSLGK
jgi:hypothetical protein